MGMKSENAETILGYIAEFVNTNPKDPGNMIRAQELIQLLQSADIVCSLEKDDEITEERPVRLHIKLTEYIESLSGGGEVGCYLDKGGVMISAFFSSPNPGPHLDLRAAGINGFIFAMLYLCAAADVKAVFRCPSCGIHVFRTGRPKKYCSNKCKQRAHRARLTPEEKQAIKQKRNRDYKRKKLESGG